MAVVDDIETTDLDQVRADARAWFESSWDPDLTLGRWWEKLGLSGWGFPTWPERGFGKGLGSETARGVGEERTRVGAPGPPSGIGGGR